MKTLACWLLFIPASLLRAIGQNDLSRRTFGELLPFYIFLANLETYISIKFLYFMSSSRESGAFHLFFFITSGKLKYEFKFSSHREENGHSSVLFAVIKCFYLFHQREFNLSPGVGKLVWKKSSSIDKIIKLLGLVKILW